MNILVVDDQPEVVEGVLSGVKWKNLKIDKVFGAYSVKEAQKIFTRENIDIILCDIEMPPTNGFELIRWAKEIKEDIASIFLSSHAEFEYAQEAVKLGSFDYILQPAPYDEIETAVASAINKVQESEKLKNYYKYRDLTEKEDSELDKRPPIERAKDYIIRNIDMDLSRSQVAEAIFLNPEYLSRLFKKETGVSLNDYIVSEKIRIAKSLLSDTNIPVGIVASKVGYSNFSYFSQVFKKNTGFSPVDYRTKMKNK